jgi:ligand-binding sensor domain-containing protein
MLNLSVMNPFATSYKQDTADDILVTEILKGNKNDVLQIPIAGMKKMYKLIYLLLVLNLSFSCVEKKSSEEEISKSEFINSSKADTLKFSSGIRAIFQDSKGNYWIGSHQEGVCLFDGKSFEYFTTNEGLSDNQISSIQEDKNGTIWFGTSNGVSSYDGESIMNQAQIVNSDAQNEWQKTDNDLWFNAGTKEGVYRYDGKKLNYLAFPNPKAIASGNVYSVTSISEGSNDMVWFATYAGIFGYNGNQFTVINDETLGLTEESGKLHVRSILEDSQGRLWIGSNGIGVLLKDSSTTVNFSENNNLINPISLRNGDQSQEGTLEHVFAIEEDSDANIWFGDRDTGAWKFDGKTVINYAIDDKLSTPMVWTIYNDKENNLLFGMAGGGVYKFNGKSFDKRF